MNFTPLTDHIILEPILAPEKSKGGVYQPTSARKVDLAKVVAMGPGGWDKVKNRPIPMPDVQIGDTVIYRAWDRQELCPSFTEQGKKYLVAEPADIFAKVTNED